MTLQVIGELILSLSAEECERVFPSLYLPIVTEANKRIWQPWREYLPTPANFSYLKTVSALNTYVSNLIRERWKQHGLKLENGEKIENPDILDRILLAVEPKNWNEVTRRAIFLPRN